MACVRACLTIPTVQIEECGNPADISGPEGWGSPDCVVNVLDLLDLLANFGCNHTGEG